MGNVTAGNDVQASNVAGFPTPIYVGGAEVIESWGFGPLPGTAMMVMMQSYNGTCYVGFRYDTASITDFDLFAKCVETGFDEVLDVGRTRPASN
jgi:hypothetical protein